MSNNSLHKIGKVCREGRNRGHNVKSNHVMEHLATFTVNKDTGIVQPLDGMRRLLQMEKNIGIWSQKMKLCIDNGCVLITDYETGDLIESFPASLIQCPTAFTSDDVLELYNNVLVFIVSAGCSVQSEMHIFQSQSISAVNLVQDIKSVQNNDLNLPTKSTFNSKGTNDTDILSLKNINIGGFKHHQETNIYSMNINYHDGFCGNNIYEDGCDRSPVITTKEFYVDSGPRAYDDSCWVSGNKYDREVNLLNSCFDDIEKFIAQLQHTAAAVREVGRRRYNKREIGEGLLNLHTRPPSEKEFAAILAKFKLSFNLLSKLKPHIHDPNAPELVHFLFTPLALIVEASRDIYAESRLSARVIDPLLTRETITFLVNCVSSKETELWRSLGSSWSTPEDQWSEKRNLFHSMLEHDLMTSQSDLMTKELTISKIEPPIFGTNVKKQTQYINDASKNALPRTNTISGKKTHIASSPKLTNAVNVQIDTSSRSQDMLLAEKKEKGVMLGSKIIFDNVNLSKECFPFLNAGTDLQQLPQKNYLNNNADGKFLGKDSFTEQWINSLQGKGANTVVVCYPRTANNDKELSVTKGEYLEILDDSRKWWKARNVHGQIAHVPSTIVAAVDYIENNCNEKKLYDFSIHSNDC